MTADFQLEGEWMPPTQSGQECPHSAPTLPPPAGDLPKGKSKGVLRRPMTADERDAVRCLGQQVGYTPATWDKRFAREMLSGLLHGGEAGALITEKEAAQVWRMFKRYRKQIRHVDKERLLAWAETHAAAEARRNG